MGIRLPNIRGYSRVRRTIHITGDAKNIGGQAVISTDWAGTYIVDGIIEWEEAWVGRKIKVKGDLEQGVIKSPVILLL